MPKVKTHSGTGKRVKQTGSGLFKIKRTGMRHLLRKKGLTNKRRLNVDKVVEGGNDRAIRYAMRARLPKQKYVLIEIDAETLAMIEAQDAKATPKA